MENVIRTDRTAEADPVSKVVYVGPSISWRGIFAGAFVGVLSFFVLGALGIAIGGAVLKSAVETASGTGLGMFTGIWMFVSSIISLFAGGYVAGRASGVLPTRIGGIEGLVVASMVFMVVLTGLGTSVSTLGGAAGSLMGSTGTTTGNIASSQQIQSVVGQAMTGLNLGSSPQMVVQGVARRLVSRDADSATDYLVSQTGISRAEASRRIDSVKSQVIGIAKDVGMTAASATQALGWTLFFSILFGSAAALWAGAMGVRRNIRHPLSESDRRVAMEARPEWFGYAYGGSTSPEPQST